jgi:hypothetical protein
MFPPKADTIFETDYPNCGKAASFIATAGTQPDDYDGSLPIARTVAQ